ncbi:flagellar hook-length control protein FliK [Pigmentibacter ruber]|uniref:flagellar hook-length control protein FliK n=1 Tax=Pigmentibacter ruber TaxID=2683196 RepID=UPI00131E0418|nr:flagellar hook-length control protein FliK [Pigmentibacter ruber]
MIQNTPKTTQLISFGATNSPKNEIDENNFNVTKYDSGKSSKETNKFTKEINKFNNKDTLPADREKETPFQKLLSNKKIENDTEFNSIEQPNNKENRKNNSTKDLDSSYLFNSFINLPTIMQNNYKQDSFNLNQKVENFSDSQEIIPIFTEVNKQLNPEFNFKNTGFKDLALNKIPYSDYFDIKLNNLNQNNSQFSLIGDDQRVKNGLIENNFNLQDFVIFKDIEPKNVSNLENKQIFKSNNENLISFDLNSIFPINNLKEIEKSSPMNVFFSNNKQFNPMDIKIEFTNNLEKLENEKLPIEFNPKIQIKEQYKNDLIKLDNGIELLPFKNDKKDIVEGFFILKNDNNNEKLDENIEKNFLGTILTKNSEKNSFLIDGNKIEFINSANFLDNKTIDFKNSNNENFSLPIFIKNISNIAKNENSNEIFPVITQKNFLPDSMKKLGKIDSFDPGNDNTLYLDMTNTNKDISNLEVQDRFKYNPIKVGKLDNTDKLENINKFNLLPTKSEEIKKIEVPLSLVGNQKIFEESFEKKNDLKMNKFEDINLLIDKQKIPLINKFDKQESAFQFSDFEQNTTDSKQNKEIIKPDDKPIIFEKTLSSQVNVPIIVSDKNNSDFSNPLISSATRRAIDLSNQLQAKGGGIAKVQIQDDKLGTIELNIQMKKDNSVSMEIKASDSNLKTVLENNSDTLKKTLDSQNISLTDFKVTTLEAKSIHNTFGAMNSQNFSQQQGSNHKQQEFSFQQNLNQNSFSGNSSNSFMNNNGNNYSAYLGDEFKNLKVNNIGNNKLNNFQNMEKNSITNIQRGANGSIKVIV